MRGSSSQHLCAGRTLHCPPLLLMPWNQSLHSGVEDIASAKRCGFTGTALSPLELAHAFHFRKAHRYFVTVLFARLCRMVAGSLLAKLCNSGSSSSSSSLQLPWVLTSEDNKTQLYSMLMTVTGNIDEFPHLIQLSVST